MSSTGRAYSVPHPFPSLVETRMVEARSQCVVHGIVGQHIVVPSTETDMGSPILTGAHLGCDTTTGGTANTPTRTVSDVTEPLELWTMQWYRPRSRSDR